MKKYIIAVMLCFANLILAQVPNKIISKTTTKIKSNDGESFNVEASFVKVEVDTFYVKKINKRSTGIINTKFPYYDYNKGLLIYDEDYILDVLDLRIMKFLVDGELFAYRKLVKEYIEPEVEYLTKHKDSEGFDIVFSFYYDLKGNFLGMYTWMNNINIPIKAIDRMEKEMKKRSIAIFNKTTSGEKFRKIPFVKTMCFYTIYKDN